MNRFFTLLSFCLVFTAGAQTYKGLIPYRKDSLWGYANASGKIVVTPQFKLAAYFSEDGLAKVQTSKGYQLIDTKGKLLPEIYGDLGGPAEGLRVAANKEKSWGYIDAKAKWVIAPQFTSVGSFKNGMAIVKKNDYYGLLNKQGYLLTDTLWAAISQVEGGFIYVVKLKKTRPGNLGDDFVVINAAGKIIRRFDNHTLVTGNLVFKNILVLNIKRVSYDNISTSLTDTAGRYHPVLLDAKARYRDWLIAKSKDGWGMLNEKGAWLMPPDMTLEPVSFINGYALFKRAGRYFAYDSTGKQVLADYQLININTLVPHTFTVIKNNTEPMELRTVQGVLLDSCKACMYMQALPGNISKVTIGNSNYIRNKTGQQLTPGFDYIGPYPDGFVVSNYKRTPEGKTNYSESLNGFYTLKGEVLLPAEYSFVTPSFIPGYLYIIDAEKRPLGYLHIASGKKFWE